MAAPVINFLSPAITSAPLTVVTIIGSNLLTTINVTFGAVSEVFLVIDASTIRATVPAQPPSTVPVVVTTTFGQSNTLFFRFVGTPCLAANTEILMADGSTKFVQNIYRGDIVAGDPENKTTFKVARLLEDKLNPRKKLFMATFWKDALEPNIPNKKTIMTAGHPVIVGNMRISAKFFTKNPKILLERIYAANILPKNEKKEFCVYDIQFETVGNYVANGLMVQSRSPRSYITPLPKELYFDPELYSPNTGLDDDPEYKFPLVRSVVDINKN
ncbi:MAG: hypothetical protein Satyrvirus7_32 [Satyrvirus sp.]|uniref:IPT/TIG domain-containing protein n=1 Tax=Satyrvirus sp. TaxID=2487771 RepID=A0A3G5ADN5_9VIRU|nr:MAG: hypothetical protein Satyrvirus7_32 [Satyrvirus sp.]